MPDHDADPIDQLLAVAIVLMAAEGKVEWVDGRRVHPTDAVTELIKVTKNRIAKQTT